MLDINHLPSRYRTMYISGRIPELIFWHIPSKAYKKVASMLWITKPCVGSINKEKVAAQEAENGMMSVLENRSSVKVLSKHETVQHLDTVKFDVTLFNELYRDGIMTALFDIFCT